MLYHQSLDTLLSIPFHPILVSFVSPRTSLEGDQ